jgi:hypothetical protein
MTWDIQTITISILILLIIVLAMLIIRLEYKMKKFLVSKSSKNIDDSLENIDARTRDLESFRIELETYLKTVETRLRKSIQAVHTLRFNPFKGTGGGGNQSFATSFINEEGNGVVISSMYSREHISIFSKPIKKFQSEFELSEEEDQSLTEARKNLGK